MGARLGQHFLKNQDVARSLVRGCSLKEGDQVLEIGPGTGALTREILETGARLIAIEKDEALVERLKRDFSLEVGEDRLNIIEADIRDITPDSLGLEQGKYVVAANIPYYITGEIMRQFLTARAQPKTIALLIQKEVAERVVSEKESLLSLSVKVFGTPSILRKVPKGDFSPPPKVDSAILLISNISRRRFASESQESAFFDMIHAGFASKRKKLSNNLSREFSKDHVAEAFRKIHIADTMRAENMPIDLWMSLLKELQHG